MQEYAVYNKKLKKLLWQSTEVSLSNDFFKQIDAALDGQAGEELRQRVSIQKRRKNGAFFTGSKLAETLSKNFNPKYKKSIKFFDPACGAGDLLLSCSKLLPIETTLKNTIDLWSKHLFGYDLYSEFVNTTKTRLLLAAIQRGVIVEGNLENILQKSFPGIEVKDTLKEISSFKNCNRVVINPPYNYVKANKDCSWATGRVTKAAIFLETIINNLNAGSEIIAILPDVLRTGERYKKWRKLIAQNCVIEKIKIIGKFDRWADVDVFILKLKIINPIKINDSYSSWNKLKHIKSDRVSDFFDVNVGAVVPYRDIEHGKEYSYLYPQNAIRWKTITFIKEKRKFKGRVFDPPFIVVRRTSRPEDEFRAVGTIVKSKKPIAVENHLLVLSPKNKTVKSCKHLLKVLKKPETNTWLNKRIRCRHLTVSAMQEMPIWKL